jgi:glycosyltransferase involved in cell wall biosynthesis
MENFQRRLFIHAANIHSGGGRSLLSALLEAWPVDQVGVLQLDARMPVTGAIKPQVGIRTVLPTVMRRLLAEWWLFRSVAKGDRVLCFGNLPPLFRLRGHVSVFLQNRYLVDPVSLASFPWKTRLRLQLERYWFKWRLGNANAVVVQTPSMQEALGRYGALRGQTVLVLPFVNASAGHQKSVRLQDIRQGAGVFLYVASGEPHKNHKCLIEAWCRLAQEGHYPALLLTLDESVNKELCAWIAQRMTAFRLDVKNLGSQPHHEILRLYTQVDAVIFPSTFESFGIPLIEARQAGLPILAAELDYVRDVVDPEQVFDPTSPISIARAVKRFMGADEGELPLLDASEFLDRILNCE